MKKLLSLILAALTLLTCSCAFAAQTPAAMPLSCCIEKETDMYAFCDEMPVLLGWEADFDGDQLHFIFDREINAIADVLLTGDVLEGFVDELTVNGTILGVPVDHKALHDYVDRNRPSDLHLQLRNPDSNWTAVTTEGVMKYDEIYLTYDGSTLVLDRVILRSFVAMGEMEGRPLYDDLTVYMWDGEDRELIYDMNYQGILEGRPEDAVVWMEYAYRPDQTAQLEFVCVFACCPDGSEFDLTAAEQDFLAGYDAFTPMTLVGDIEK